MDLKSYIKGNRHGKTANKLEKKAMNDPFLQDAIDGFDSVPGDHFSTIEKLEKQLAPQPKRIDKRVWIWAAAAVIVLLTGIPFLLRQPDIKDVQVASSESVEQEEDVVLSPEKDSVLVAENFDIAEKETSKPVQTPPPAVKENERKPTGQIILEQVVVEGPPDKETRVAAVRDLAETAIETPASPTSDKLSGRATGVAISPVNENKLSKDFRIRGTSSIAPANQKLVYGRLVDEAGEPIIGGTVMVKNEKEGTISDTDGNFRLIVPKNEQKTLIASYVGMENKEIPLKENVGNIVMKEDTDLLREVVVTGYGTQRKTATTGAATKIKNTVPTFGETEFKQYFRENYDKTICADEPVTIKVEFYVNVQGQPGNIVIKENSCPEFETEIKRLLLGSPKWSQTNRKVTLNITLNE